MRVDGVDNFLDPIGLPVMIEHFPIEYLYGPRYTPEVEKWAALLKPTMPSAPLFDTSYSAHEAIHVHFLRTTEDVGMKSPVQQRVIDFIERTAISLRIESLESDHSPFIGHTKKTAAFLIRSAGERTY